MFSICSHLGGGGTPSQPRWVPPSQGRYPPAKVGTPPAKVGTPLPGEGRYPLPKDLLHGEGMPLAFTQEDFLVLHGGA